MVADAWAFPSDKFTPALEAVGSTLGPMGRRGKYLLVPLRGSGGDRELVVHLGMTGRLFVEGDGDHEGLQDPPARHHRARFVLADGRRLVFDDVRRFGRIAVVPTGDHSALPTLAALGPEPWDEHFDAEHLRRSVNASTRAIKTQLLSQRVVAGVGNIYADEALWRAGIRPSARRLTRVEAERLRTAIVEVLTEGIDNGGTTLRDYRDATGRQGRNQERLVCYGRSGLPCLRCGTALRRSVIDARSTTWCPSCQ